MESDILESADDALSSLSTLLDENEWFFGQEKPDLFDASVFAYTHLLLDKSMKWEDNGLGERLKKYENLVTHQRRIAEMYY